MPRVVNIDHLSIHVSDFRKSKEFYGKLFKFLGFEVMEESGGKAMGWTNGKTRFWITQAKRKTYKYHIGDVGYHHYAFELQSRKDVDELGAFVKKLGAKIIDPPDEYYEDYYAVFFLDPDGLKLEGVKYGETPKKRGKRKKS